MDRIELHDLEYGDCTVLVGRDQSILMVDCGSVSQFVRRGEAEIHTRFESVFLRYAGAKNRQFLLTHYHRDHLRGFLWKLRQDPLYFDRVYLPYIPPGPLLKIALYAHFFAAPQSDFAQVNTACLTLFSRLYTLLGAYRLYVLRENDRFLFDAVPYRILSPGKDFPYPPALSDAADACTEVLRNLPDARTFLRLAEEFLYLFEICQNALSPAFARTASAQIFSRLSVLWNELETLRGTPEAEIAADAVRDILAETSLRVLYTETQNDLSLVLHNERLRTGGADILLPGDASAAILDRLAPRLYDGYFAVKAPHHGTESHWSDTLGRMEIAHLLISNGDYHAGSEISGRYIATESIKHCTNPSACSWYRENGSCCNRLSRCWEQPGSGNLTLKCTAAAGNRRTPCGIYVFGHNGVLACHCDR